jgi:signal transduction histidine kinase
MIPTNQDFATEVKAERLKILWRITLIVCIFVIWIILNIAVLQRLDAGSAVAPFIALVLGCLVTRQLLDRGQLTPAVWAYALGGMAALAVGLVTGSPQIVQILSFAFPVVVFLVGLLLSPGNTFLTAVVSSLLIAFVPFLQAGDFSYFSVYQAAAIALTFLSAVLAMQVTGDLYQVTEWALQNYQRERRVAGELYDNRQELQRSLSRSQALSDRLQETNEQLETARTAAEDAKHFRGQFLANMSHELRTPLNAIIGFSETMLKFPAMYDGVKLPNAYEADLQQIYSSGRQLLNLINDILDLSKVDAGKLDIQMDKVDLKAVVSNVVLTASGLIGAKPIALETDLPDVVPFAWADRARVSQVLLNLYSNAGKFTDQGSIKLSLREADGLIRISLTDTGIGIAPENYEAIFEEFKQAETGRRDPRAGAGLGLAISRQLVTLMGGKIWVESTFGKGSTFHFTLQPFHEEKANGSSTSDSVAKVAVGNLTEKVT